MSAALVVQLRESLGYLRDGGYHQTAQLVAAAADEIERLHRERQLLDAANPAARRPVGLARQLAKAASPPTRENHPAPREGSGP
jgi:hypothetical protein